MLGSPYATAQGAQPTATRSKTKISPYAATQEAQPAPRAKVDLSRVEAVVNEDERVRQSLVKLQKDLNRSKASLAQQRRLMKAKNDGAQVRTVINELTCKDVIARMAGVAPATEELQIAIASLLNQRLHAMGQDLWMKMFKVADADNSGRITYVEFAQVNSSAL